MANTSNVQIFINISEADPDLDAEELEASTRQLKNEIQDLVEDASLVRASEMPEKGKSAFAGFLVGMLKTEVNVKSIKALFSFLGERLGGKPIEMTIKAPDGRELSLKAGSREEFAFAMQQAQDFLGKP